MAHGNIDERRDHINFLMSIGTADKEIKKIVSVKFLCHYSAVNADLQFIRHRATGQYHLSRKIRYRIFERDGKKCCYCQADRAYEFIVEHIVPASMGGKSVEYNLVIACSHCNLKKRKQIWIPVNFMEISKNNLEHLNYVLQNATKDFR